MTYPQDPPDPRTYPLIRTPRLSRRLLVSAAAATAMIPFCRTMAAQGPRATPVTLATPVTTIEGDADAVALLEAAAEAVAALESFGFELATTRGASTILEGFELMGVEGVVSRPMDIEAEVTVGLPIGEITITAVGVDGEFWIQDPLSDGEWISLGGDRQFQSLINPDTLILLAVRLIQDAQITGTEKLGGVETTVVEGTVDFFSALESTANSADGSEILRQYLVEGPRDVTFWIDDENRVVEVEIRGPIFVTESDDVVRVISLFDFNEPVQIEVPEGA